MSYTLATLKSAVLAAAIASDKQWVDGVTDNKTFIKAVKKAFPNDKNDARTRGYWLGFATYFGINNQPWKDAKTQKGGDSLKDIKAQVLAHYQCADSKALRKKLDEWQVPYGDLRKKAAWAAMLADVTPYQAAA